MKITRIVNSVFTSNTFVLIDEESPYCWLVDAGDIEPILEVVGDREVKGVFITHTHYDHIYGINRLVEHFPDCVIYTSEHGKEGLFSCKLNFSKYHDEPLTFQGRYIEVLEEGDEVSLFPYVTLKAVSTPGHDWSCMSYCTDELIFTGDSYIPNIKVITSMPKSNKVEAEVSLARILHLAQTRNVYPGHNEIQKLK